MMRGKKAFGGFLTLLFAIFVSIMLFAFLYIALLAVGSMSQQEFKVSSHQVVIGKTWLIYLDDPLVYDALFSGAASGSQAQVEAVIGTYVDDYLPHDACWRLEAPQTFEHIDYTCTLHKKLGLGNGRISIPFSMVKNNQVIDMELILW